MNTNSIKNISLSTAVYNQDYVSWFPIGLKSEALQKISSLQRKGILVLKLGVNCSEFNTMQGAIWYDWLMSILGDKFELELCFLNNCPVMSPKKPSSKQILSETVECFINKFGGQFNRIELCRNPGDKFIPINSSTNIYSDELVFAATWAVFMKKKITIGGVQAGDFEWLMLLMNSGFFEKVDAIRLDTGADNWSTNTNYLEQAIVGVLQEHNFKTRVFSTSPKVRSKSA